MWETIVGNVGSVYYGASERKARRAYKEYVEASKANTGRAGGESVVLFKDGEIVAEHRGMVET